MTLKRLSVTNLRNLSAVEIQPGHRVNFIYGANGSGKTSLLEAISILGMGRSFRSHKLRPVIRRGADIMTVFGKLGEGQQDIPVGVQRAISGQATIKVDGVQVNSAAKLAENLPLQLIDSQSFLLLEGAPKVRRQFLDWLVFHVKPNFLLAWKGAQQCIKHRNSLLRRDRIDPLLLAPWDKELAGYSQTVDSLRRECFDSLLETFDHLISEFVPVDGLKLSYYRGWEHATDYLEYLSHHREKDRLLGYTGSGPHRADIKIRIGQDNAAQVLSRGQQKLLVCALRIAQGLVFSKLSQRQCVFLIDDLPAELDSTHRTLLAKWLDQIGCQVFVTGVEKEVLLESWPQTLTEDERTVFHVEQGQVSLG
ncbi:DNA replication/repair protein RecF [Exilibacterium tricleocarpae]|uniref:DNA replication and repair protein RecF n=1 Tax=Exilibacterium tricleocarpae TaxID=2591008 RepID=A0A545TZS3_9GAMM|nr:DNA replication/repair protein RecF [Exilibacterium tricleocarpae]TQV82718.1 DNA replication/repair protein RecF [Exilibacterium tricleocarpae]